MEYLRKDSLHQTFHDADTRFNVLFARNAAESSGSFILPWFYPGNNFTVTFGNGTSRTFQNYASTVSDSDSSWSSVVDGQSFYDNFVDASTVTTAAVASTTSRVSKRSVPTGYPNPVIEHSSADINLGGFFLSGTNLNDVAVLSINTFDYETSSEGQRFQKLIQDFFALCKLNNKTKLIVDVSSNGGGALFLGYDTFKQVWQFVFS